MFANLIIRYKLLIIICVILLAGGSVLLLPLLKVDVQFSNFFPKGDAQLDFYKEFTSKMGSNDLFIFCAVKADKSVFDLYFLRKADKFVLNCQKLPFIRNVSSITNSNRFYKTPFGIISYPYLHLDTPEKFEKDSLRIVKDSFLTKRFVSTDHQYLSFIIELEKGLDLNQADTAMVQIDSLISLHGLKNSHLLGRKYMEVQYNKMVAKELGRSLLLSLIFIVVVLGFLYRSLSGILLPVLSMILAFLILCGFLALTGRSLGILANLFPTIMLIVGISDVIHIFNKNSLEIQKGRNQRQAIKKTIKEIGLTTFLTSFTTAAGFLTLTTSSMPAIRNFGFDAAAGVLIAYGVSIVFVPAILLTLGLRMPLKSQIFTKYWDSFCEKLFQLTTQIPGRILNITFFITGIALIGIFQIDTNNLQLTNIPDVHRLKTDYKAFEEHMGGGRSFEMAVICKNEFDLSTLSEIRTLHNYLESLPELEKVFSPITLYYGISKIFERRLPLFELPESDEKLNRYVKSVKNSIMGSDWKLVDSTQTIGRISARMKDLGRKKVKTFNSKISAWIGENLDTTHLQFYFTGTDLLFDRGHELRIQNMGQGLIIAIFVVALLMGLIFKSSRIIIIVLLVNVLPLLLLGGVMGFMGIELRGHTSIIFTIAFVIAVDDTIHFLSKFKIERQKGLSVREAVRKTMQESLKAIIVTSIILFGGFFVYVVGVLVSTSLLFALIIDVFLLPVLILRFIKDDA